MHADNISNVGGWCVSSRRSAKAPRSSPDPTTFRQRLCERVPCSPTPCRPTLIAARAGRGHVRDRTRDRCTAVSSASIASRSAAASHRSKRDALRQRRARDLRQRPVRIQHGSRHAHRDLSRCREATRRRQGARPPLWARPCQLRGILDRRAARAPEITVSPDGPIDVVIGAQPGGQGHETSFAQVIADLLSVPVEQIRIIMVTPMW